MQPTTPNDMAQLDHSDDFLVWDNSERITYESTDGRKASVAGCLRIELTLKEQAVSGGGYLGADLNWLIPRKRLPAGFVMGDPGSTVTDDKGNSFTVLDCAKQVRDKTDTQVFRLHTRNLAIAYQLRDLITIERAHITYDAAGAMVKSWPPAGGSNLYASLPAKVQLLSKEFSEERGISGFKGTHAVYVSRQVPLVTFEDRIRWTDAGVTYYLNIAGVRNPERLDELPLLDAILAV